MTWAQYWALQLKNIEVSAICIAGLLVLGVIGLVGFLAYDKIQDRRGK
jgi:hypothetical protein